MLPDSAAVTLDARAQAGIEILELLEWADGEDLVIMQWIDCWIVITRNRTPDERWFKKNTLPEALRAAKEAICA